MSKSKANKKNLGQVAQDPNLPAAFAKPMLVDSGEFLLQANTLQPLERKDAALLSYLALEGPTLRSKIAGLLWPDSGEEIARNNLRQRLHRIKNKLGSEVIVGTERLELSPEIEIDAGLTFHAKPLTPQHLHRVSDELLSGHSFDDCPELDEWIVASRERLKLQRRDGIYFQLEKAESENDYLAAISWSTQLIVLDPISEESYRRMMRLQYLQGDRAGALMTYQRCIQVLHKELGVGPLPETLELAQLLERGSNLGGQNSQRPPIPLAVLRPPTLVGREQAWHLLEQAWQHNTTAQITGEPGIGKTRLMLDFVNTKGEYIFIDGRIGENTLPFAAIARMCRSILGKNPSTQFQDWERLELCRLIPSLHTEPAPALQSQEQKLRFFEAIAALVLKNPNTKTIVADNLQFIDSASQEAIHFLFTRLGEHQIRSIMAFRSNELLSEIENDFNETSTMVSLEALRQEELDELIDSLNMPALAGLNHTLMRRTGGNPLFVLEILKNLFETGQIEEGILEKLPTPKKLVGLLSKRLESLSAPALKLARVAAVLGAAFNKSTAAKMLNLPVQKINTHWKELQTAQILNNNFFAHDLLFETTLTSIPTNLSHELHKKALQVLSKLSLPAGILADHAKQAEDYLAALKHYTIAITEAMHIYALRETVILYQQLRECLSRMQQQANTPLPNIPKSLLQPLFNALMFSAEASSILGDFELVKQSCEEAATLATAAKQTSWICFALNRLGFSAAQLGSDLDFALNTLSRSLEIAKKIGGQALTETEQVMALLYTFPLQGLGFKERLGKARQHGESAMNLSNKLNLKIGQADSHNVLAYIECYLGEWDKAKKHAQVSENLYAKLGRRVGETDCQVLQARIYNCQGSLDNAIELASTAAIKAMHLGFSEQATAANFCWASAKHHRGDFIEVKKILEAAQVFAEKTRPQYRVSMLVLAGANCLANQQLDLAAAEFLKATKVAASHGPTQTYPESWWCVLECIRGNWGKAHQHAIRAHHWREPSRFAYLPNSLVFESLVLERYNEKNILKSLLLHLEIHASKSLLYELVYAKTKAALAMQQHNWPTAKTELTRMLELSKSLGMKAEQVVAENCFKLLKNNPQNFSVLELI